MAPDDLKGQAGARAEIVLAALSRPTPATLWQIRAAFLEAGAPVDAPVWAILDQFYHFLNRLVATATSRQYSHFASLLDIGAVGGVAAQNLLLKEGVGSVWQRALAGGLSEGLMVLAARQYVRAWEGEMEAVFRAASWNLYGELWRTSELMNGDLAPTERRRLLEELLNPLRDAAVSGTVKATLIGRLYQLLLLSQLPALAATAGAADQG